MIVEIARRFQFAVGRIGFRRVPRRTSTCEKRRRQPIPLPQFRRGTQPLMADPVLKDYRSPQAVRPDDGPGRSQFSGRGRRAVRAAGAQRGRQNHAAVDCLLLVGARQRLGLAHSRLGREHERPRSACMINCFRQDSPIDGESMPAKTCTSSAALYPLLGATLQLRIDEVLAAVGLTDCAGERVEGFSGGVQSPRFNLGAAPVHEPRLLLLDEPTTGVDPQYPQSHFRGSAAPGRPRRGASSTRATISRKFRPCVRG